MDIIQRAAPSARYSRGAVLLHWSIALLIAANFVVAWLAEDKPRAVAMQMMTNHKAIGLTVLVLSILRLVWRLTHPVPAPAASLQGWEVTLARITHALFYVLMIGLPLGGWLAHSAWSGGAPINFFGLFDLPGLPMSENPDLGETFGELHGTVSWVLLGLMAIHIAGALKHQFIDRDPSILRRMSLRSD